MKPPKSKDAAGIFSPAWALAYLLAALGLAGAMLLVWQQEDHRPWQEEVRAVNQERARRLSAKMT